MFDFFTHDPRFAPCSSPFPRADRPNSGAVRWALTCGLLSLCLGFSGCGKRSDSNLDASSGKAKPKDGFTDAYVAPPPQGRFTEIEEVVDRGKHLVRYKVEITNPTAFPKKWFKGAPELPSVGSHSTAARCVIEVVDPSGKVLQQFAEAERDLRIPVWFAVAPGAAVPETVRLVIHDRQTQQRYQSEPIELPRPEPTDEELAANSPEEEAATIPHGEATDKVATKPDPKKIPDSVEYLKIDGTDKDLAELAGKFAEVTATVREARRTKGGDHLVVSCADQNFMLFCSGKYTSKVFGEGDPMEKLTPGTRLKVRGKITLFRKQPQIVLKSPDQLVEIKAGEGDNDPGKEQAATSVK